MTTRKTTAEIVSGTLSRLGITKTISVVKSEEDKIWDYCKTDYIHFITTYCYILDSVTRDWILFDLWDAQIEALNTIYDNKLIAWLKARQLGASWSVLAFGLWDMIFNPVATFLIFSRRETEAVYLLGQERLRGAYHRLPDWMKARSGGLIVDAGRHLQLGNGSVARAFPTGVGDSYTATLALVDEADLAPDMNTMLTSIKPTIDAGGRLILVGRVNKQKTVTPFKTVLRDSINDRNSYAHIFHPWYVHPLRDQKWYDEQVRDALSIDDVYEQYPETVDQALSRSSHGKVFPAFSLVNNVSSDADYVEGYPIEWWVDDGYTNPLVILFVQQRPFQGYPDHLCVFDELYLTQTDHDEAIKIALTKGYPPPTIIWHDPSANRLASRLSYARNNGVVEVDQSNSELTVIINPFICSVNAANNKVADGLKAVRHSIGPDVNGIRLLRMHPRDENLIVETSDYEISESSSTTGGDPVPLKERDHGPDCLRYGHSLRMYR